MPTRLGNFASRSALGREQTFTLAHWRCRSVGKVSDGKVDELLKIATKECWE